jgi:hypothetical protein
VIGATTDLGTDLEAPGPAITDRSRMYDYDPIGNRQSYTEGAAPPTTYTTNNVNQYPATADPAEAFLYDKDGNLIEDGDFLYSWDLENRLESVVPKSPSPGHALLMFEYDYEMRRVRKVAYPWDDALGDWSTTPSQDLRFVYDGWNLLLELDGRDLSDGSGGDPDSLPDNAMIRKYTWGLDLAGQSGAQSRDALDPSRDREGAGSQFQGAGGIGGMVRGALRQRRSIRLFIETDDERAADPQGRRPQLARRAEHGLEEFGVAGRVGFHIERDDRWAPGDDDFRGGLRQRQRVAAAQFRLARRDGLFGRDSHFRKEPLRLGATGSARAVVIPFHVSCDGGLRIDDHRIALMVPISWVELTDP